MKDSKGSKKSGEKKEIKVDTTSKFETVLQTLTKGDLHKLFPRDSNYVDATLKELELHEKKAAAYAAAGDPLGNFDRVSGIFNLYSNLDLSDRRVYLLSMLLKHLDAILANLAAGIDLPDFQERALDISVYAKILSTM